MKPSSHDPEYEKLRAWLKQRREDSGLSLRAIGERLGRDFSILAKIERARRKVDLVEYVEYCLEIGADPCEGVELVAKSLKSRPVKK